MKGFIWCFLNRKRSKSLRNLKKEIQEEKGRYAQERTLQHEIQQRQMNEQARANRLAAMANDLALRYNKIGRFAVITGFVTSVVAVAVFVYNFKAINAATKASAVADSTFKLTQRQFEIENTPYLQVDNIKLHFYENGMDTVTFVVKSLGDRPITTTADVSMLAVYYKQNNDQIVTQIDSSIFAFPPFQNIRYISKEVPLELSTFEVQKFLDKNTLDSIESKKMNLILVGKIIYLNPINGKLRAYVYQAQLFPKLSEHKIIPQAHFFFSYNENFDITQESTMDMFKKVVKQNEENRKLETQFDKANQQENNEFNKTITPYFETIVNSIDAITTKKIEISYSIFNLSSRAAKIVNEKMDYYSDSSLTEEGVDVNTIFDSMKTEHPYRNNTIISRDNPFVSKFEIYPPNKEFSAQSLDSLLYMNNYLYIVDEIKFQDLLSGKLGLYRYIIKIKPAIGRRGEFSQVIYNKIVY